MLLEEELMRCAYMMNGGSSLNREQQRDWEAAWRRVLQRCFLRMDKMASYNCDCGSLGYYCSCPPNSNLSMTGSTAVIAILTDHIIVIANCGDSRAVLCRDGIALPLSFDHKVINISAFSFFLKEFINILYNSYHIFLNNKEA